MKTLIFLDTTNIFNKEIETFILCVSAFKDIKTDLTPFEVDRIRTRKPLLITTFDKKLNSTNLYNYDELANLGNEGFKLESVKSLEDYSNKLANEYKYY